MYKDLGGITVWKIREDMSGGFLVVTDTNKGNKLNKSECIQAGEIVSSKVQRGRAIWGWLWIPEGEDEKVILCKAHNVPL